MGRRIPVIGLAVLLSAGCVSTVKQQTPSSWHRENLSGSIEQKTKGYTVVWTSLTKEREYDKESLVLRRDNDALSTSVQYWRARGDEKRPVVIVSPILGGVTDVERMFLKYFASHGMDAAIVEQPQMEKAVRSAQTTEQLFSILEGGMQKAARDYHDALDVILAQPSVRPDRTCAFGISFGGIRNTIAAANDPRIKYTVLALTGRTDEILGKAAVEPMLKRIAQKFFPQFGGRDGFMRELNLQVPTQPQNYAAGLDPDRTLMIIARYDKVVPRTASEDIRKRAGSPRTVYLLGGHYTSIIYALPFPIIQGKSLDFFKEKIAADDAR